MQKILAQKQAITFRTFLHEEVVWNSYCGTTALWKTLLDQLL